MNLVGRRLGMPVPPTLVYDYPTVDAITAHLAAKAEADAAAAAPRSGACEDNVICWLLPGIRNWSPLLSSPEALFALTG